MNLDVLVIAAHPDDAELGMGGTIALLSAQGKRVGIIDLTQGEMSTRGNETTRQQEAVNAAIALKTVVRQNLFIPDGSIAAEPAQIAKVVAAIRKYRPKIVFSPHFSDRHPDHEHAARLVKEAFFSAGLAKYATAPDGKPQEAFRPSKLYYYMMTYTFQPSFIVDISSSFQAKMKAIMAFSSQFYDAKSNEPETFISRPGFMQYIEARAKFYGFQIGKEYGEPFYSEEALEFNPGILL